MTVKAIFNFSHYGRPVDEGRSVLREGEALTLLEVIANSVHGVLLVRCPHLNLPSL